MSSEEYREPVTTYRELAGELRQWWRENIVFNWPTHLILTVINVSYLYLHYTGTVGLYHPIELNWMALPMTVYWLVEDWKDGG